MELFDFGLGQDIQGSNSKNGTKGKIEEIQGGNHHMIHEIDSIRERNSEEIFYTDSKGQVRFGNPSE